MLTIPIAGQLAIPIRAIPYCSHGFLSAASVAAFLANPNSIAGEYDPHTCNDPDHPLTRYDGPPAPFRIDALGQVERLHPGIFHSIPQQVADAAATGHTLDAVKALPPGVFVWLKDVRALFYFLDFQLHRQEYNARGDVEHFRHWLDAPFVNIDTVTTELILEGTGNLFGSPPKPTPTPASTSPSTAPVQKCGRASTKTRDKSIADEALAHVSAQANLGIPWKKIDVVKTFSQRNNLSEERYGRILSNAKIQWSTFKEIAFQNGALKKS